MHRLELTAYRVHAAFGSFGIHDLLVTSLFWRAQRVTSMRVAASPRVVSRSGYEWAVKKDIIYDVPFANIQPNREGVVSSLSAS